jgi:hypothetical protein
MGMVNEPPGGAAGPIKESAKLTAYGQCERPTSITQTALCRHAPPGLLAGSALRLVPGNPQEELSTLFMYPVKSDRSALSSSSTVHDPRPHRARRLASTAQNRTFNFLHQEY